MRPILTSTYRLQLRAEFGFDHVAGIVPYLQQLGVSHVYLSPILQAAPGSTHGYDVVDHTALSSDLGGRDAYERMSSVLRAHGMGQIVDIVPNHMAIPGKQNAWWWDVLRNGHHSRYAEFFDIDWSSVERSDNKLLLPVLGKRFGEVLRDGELQVVDHGEEPVLRYYDSIFPLSGSLDGSLIDIIERQHYRLAYWRMAGQDLEYRRFFDINSLMALRAERQDVFDSTHALIKELVDENHIDGLRVDHVDGLADPLQYLTRLRALVGPDRYIFVEKILESGERLRSSWPIDGTTGYDAMRMVDGLFVDPANERTMTSTYVDFVASETTWEETEQEAKALVVRELFGSDIARLTSSLRRIGEQTVEARDYSYDEVKATLSALLVGLDVYRPYIAPEVEYVTEDDEAIVVHASHHAKAQLASDLHDLVDFIVELLLLRSTPDGAPHFVERFQQMSGPVMAKGVEDTSCYRYNRFVTLNEVGGAPGRFGVRPDQFHEAASEALRTWPHRMVASTTHDTKRSEDTRYRLAVLSEIPDRWRSQVTQWAEHNERYKRDGWPDANTEYLIYQTLVGAHPISEARLQEYVLKATREAHVTTNWQNPAEDVETATAAFVTSLMLDNEFQQSLALFVEPLIGHGHINSLAATVLKLTMPGLADIYQGTELGPLTLVDPDNRQAVDFDVAASCLDEGATDSKSWLTQRLLTVRRDNADCFGTASSYSPVVAHGKRAANVVAYSRGEMIVIVPRLVVSLQNDWLDTSLDVVGSWRNVLTNELVETFMLADVLKDLPVAVLIKA